MRSGEVHGMLEHDQGQKSAISPGYHTVWNATCITKEIAMYLRLQCNGYVICASPCHSVFGLCITLNLSYRLFSGRDLFFVVRPP